MTLASTSQAAPHPKLGRTIAANLEVPWGVVFLSSGAAIVSERGSGHLVRVDRSGRVTTLGRVAGVAAPTGLGEGGLLGIALAPGDQDTLFAYITTSSDNRVVRLSIAGGRVGRPHVVLAGIPTSTHHHGGRLLFDRSHQLFVSTGDAEHPTWAQEKKSLAGKILRLRPDGRASAGNPFGNRVWTYGHRNIEGLAFDAAGRLWATEFGNKKADELNLVIRGLQLRLAARGRAVQQPPLPLTQGDVVTHQHLLTFRSGHHPVDGLCRGLAGGVPICGTALGRHRWTAEGLLQGHPRADPKRCRGPRRRAVDHDQQHGRTSQSTATRRQDPARDPMSG